MKKRISLLLFLLCVLFSDISALEPILLRNVSLNEALDAIRVEFQNEDVDYYLYNGNNGVDTLEYWQIFVDAEPNKGWEHNCYLAKIRKRVASNHTILPDLTLYQLPPVGDLTPLSVMDRDGGTHKFDKPHVAVQTATGDDLYAAQHTYALIINGGVTPYANHERYWNNCSFLYQTLVNRYSVPKANVYVAMSDGTDTGNDMFGVDLQLHNSSLDLDFDNIADVQYAATRQNITNIFDQLALTLQEDDHLFVCVISHGGQSDWWWDSYISLWNDEKIYPQELSDYLAPFTNIGVNVNVLLGQNYSGAFVDYLNQVGCVVTTATDEFSKAYISGDRPYDDFIYWWTSAINGNDTYGNAVEDVDANGRVSMQEAYEYTELLTRFQGNPMFRSVPPSIGEDLAFNNRPESIDLYIRDTPDDTGKEPNVSAIDNAWSSPDIWIRNNPDSIEEHENPIYSSSHTRAYIYVKIHNRGKKDYEGGLWLHVYWALASTNMDAKTWKSRETYENRYVTGEHLRAIAIPPIAAGDSTTKQITWELPDDIFNDQSFTVNMHHFCILARIMDSHIDDSYDPNNPYVMCDKVSNNDIAQKNLYVISGDELSNGFKVYVRNTADATSNYSLEIRPHSIHDEQLFTVANVHMEMSDNVYSAWQRGGMESENIAPARTHNPNTIRLLKNSKLKKLSLYGDEFDAVTLSFGFTRIIPGVDYSFDLIQKDEDGNIVGGETFTIKIPQVGTFPPQSIMDGEIETEDDTNEGILFASPSVNVINTIDVTLKSEVSHEGCSIAIHSLFTGTVIYSSQLAIGDRYININTESFPSGMYVISYMKDGVVMNNARFSK